MFYKNALVVLTMFFYSFMAMASTTKLFTEVFWQTNNIFMTSLPIIIFGFNEMDVPKSVAASRSELYSVGITHTRYTHVKFFGWMAEAFFAAALCTFIPIACFGLTDSNFATLSFTSMHLVILGGNMRLTIEQNSWSLPEAAAFWLMIAAFELACIIFSNAPKMLWTWTAFSWYELGDVQGLLYGDAVFWICLLLTIVLLLCPRLLVKAWVIITRPSLQMQVMWLMKSGKLPIVTATRPASASADADYSTPYSPSSPASVNFS